MTERCLFPTQGGASPRSLVDQVPERDTKSHIVRLLLLLYYKYCAIILMMSARISNFSLLG